MPHHLFDFTNLVMVLNSEWCLAENKESTSQKKISFKPLIDETVPIFSSFSPSLSLPIKSMVISRLSQEWGLLNYLPGNSNWKGKHSIQVKRLWAQTVIRLSHLNFLNCDS